MGFFRKTLGFCRKTWNFLWHEDSVTSWVVSIALAFLVVKFLLYPLIGLALGTSYPIVAVVSESMEHNAAPVCLDYKNGKCINESESKFKICGQEVNHEGFFAEDLYWETCGGWYKEHNISKKGFSEFSFDKGFNKGDIMVLIGKQSKDINIGDVVVFDGGLNYPVIHRVVNKWYADDAYYITTKGDNNEGSSNSEIGITEDKVLGKAVLRLPLLGWVKIGFSSLVESVLGVFK